MAQVFLIILCVSAATAACDIKSDAQSNRAADFVGSFGTNFDFLNYFFSAGNIDKYKYSSENVPDAHLTALGSIAITYSTLRGEFVTWCTYVDNVFIDPNNPAHQEVRSLPEYDPTRGPSLFAQLTSKSSEILREMKQSLQSIAVNGGNNVRLRDNCCGQQRYKRSSNPVGEALEDNRETPYRDDVSTARSIIDHLLNMINNNLTIYLLNASQMKCKCSPILRYAALTGGTIPTIAPATSALYRTTTFQQAVLPADGPQANVPPEGNRTVVRTPKPSKDDLLERHPESCVGGSNFGRNSPSVPSCNAYLVKSSLNLLNKFYLEEEAVAGFLNRISSSRLLSECREHLTDFIKNQYLSWGYSSSTMRDTQMLHISVRLDDKKSFRVQIVN